MSSIRVTRRAKRHEARRHTYKQRGGAAWAPVFASEEDERFKDWVEEISGNTELKELFPSLMLLNRNDPAPTSDEEKQERLLTYFNCMAHQDKLFRAALNIIRKKLGEKIPVLKDVSSSDLIVENSTEIDKSDSLKEYLRDVEKFVRFDYTLPPGNYKLLQILRQSLSTILLFPAKVENIFIQVISELIVSIIKNQNVIKQASESDSIKKILATQYESYAHSLSYTLASTPLWDGYYLVQPIRGDIDKNFYISRLSTPKLEDIGKILEETFWYKFVTGLVNNMDISEEGLFKQLDAANNKCVRSIINIPFERLAADFCRYAAIQKENMNILQFITSSGINDCSDNTISEVIRKKIPEEIYDTVTITGSSITFKKLLSNVGRVRLEFLLHLEVGIKECLSRRAAEESKSE